MRSPASLHTGAIKNRRLTNDADAIREARIAKDCHGWRWLNRLLGMIF